LALILLAAPASGDEVSSAQLRQLAQAAESDPIALARLRAVDRVDGQHADVQAALAGANPTELAARLRVLAGGTATGDGITTTDPRKEAAHILAGRRFHERKTPAPLRGALHWLGQRLYPLVRPIVRLYRAILRNTALTVIAAALILLLGVLVGIRLARHRSAAADRDGGGGRLRRRQPEDPAALEAAADEAERAGDLDRALRLRFRAGLLRLDRAGVIQLQPSITTGQLRTSVASPTFGNLAWRFDEVAYGSQPARREDIEAAKSAWPRVFEEVRR
jgi:hypothetical protein